MEKKLLYETPHTEEFEINLEHSCLQNTSDVKPTIDDMDWDD